MWVIPEYPSYRKLIYQGTQDISYHYQKVPNPITLGRHTKQDQSFLFK